MIKAGIAILKQIDYPTNVTKGIKRNLWKHENSN
jgi:hypothetical protein